MLLGGVMFMFVGGEVKHMAFAVGGAILFSGTYSIDFNIIFFSPTLFSMYTLKYNSSG